MRFYRILINIYRLPFLVKLSLSNSSRSDLLMAILRILLFLASWAVTVMKLCSRLTLTHSRLWISAFLMPVLRAIKITYSRSDSAFATSNPISLCVKRGNSKRLSPAILGPWDYSLSCFLPPFRFETDSIFKTVSD